MFFLVFQFNIEVANGVENTNFVRTKEIPQLSLPFWSKSNPSTLINLAPTGRRKSKDTS